MRSCSLDFVNPPKWFLHWLEAVEEPLDRATPEAPESPMGRGVLLEMSGSRDRQVTVEIAQPWPRGPRSSTPA